MNKHLNPIYIFLIAAGGLLVLVFFRRFIFFLLPVFLLAGLITMAVSLVEKYQRRKKIQAEANSIEGIINHRLQLCNEEIDRNNREIRDIKINIRDLEFRLNQNFEINKKNRTETLEVIKGFKSELALRETKVSFYQTCKKKLTSLLYNHNLSKDLIRKKERLTQLQESTLDEAGEVQMMKFDLEHDILYAETIGDLSTQMMDINSMDTAKALQLQLVEMTKELRDL